MNERLKAVDVVIVPPREVTEKAVDLSAKLHGSSFVLSKDDRVPHITLMMGYADDVSKTAVQVESIIKNGAPINVCATGIKTSKGATSVTIEKSQVLNMLHYRLMDGVNLRNSLMLPNAYFAGDLGIGDSTLDWLSSFVHAHARRNFEPHLTLGDGRLDERDVDLEFPVNFLASNISMFHLGDHNTCRKLLASWQLGS